MAIIFRNPYKNRAHPCAIPATFSPSVRSRLDPRVRPLVRDYLGRGDRYPPRLGSFRPDAALDGSLLLVNIEMLHAHQASFRRGIDLTQLAR